AKSHLGAFAQGDVGDSYTVIVRNATSAGPTSGNVIVTESVPSGLTLNSMSGAGWACNSNTCSRNDVLGPGASYPPINVQVNVSLTATSPQVNQVTVSGGGSPDATTSDSTFITATGSTNPGAEIDNLNITDSAINFSSFTDVCVNTYVFDASHKL